MENCLDVDDKLKKTLRKLFPDLLKELDCCKSQTEVNAVHKKHLLVHTNNLNKLLKKPEISADEITDSVDGSINDQTAPIVITPEMYKNLVKAEGNDIKNQLHVIIDGLARLKGMEKDDPGKVTAQIVYAGCLAVGNLALNATVRSLAAGAVDAVAAYVGVEAATVGTVVAIATVVVVAVVIPLIYFMEKPANGILLLINELDDEITFIEDYNVSGKQQLVTTPIPRGLVIADKHYVSGGLIGSTKRENALIGTQYGVTYRYKDTQFQFAFLVPLTGIYGDNNCYCDVGSDAKTAAEKTSEYNKQKYVAKKDGIKLEIKVNSGSGSIAYFIARVYK